jgi:hypothetical protein
MSTAQSPPNTIYCIQQANNQVIDCCRNIDLNGDGIDDLLVSCNVPNLRVYAELINTKGTGFCVRRQSSVPNPVISGVPNCTS